MFDIAEIEGLGLQPSATGMFSIRTSSFDWATLFAFFFAYYSKITEAIV